MLDRGMPDDDLRTTFRILAQIGDEKAVEPLLVRVSNEPVSGEAAAALREILRRRAPAVAQEVLSLIANLADNIPGLRLENSPAAGTPSPIAETREPGTLRQLAAIELARRKP